MRPTRSRTRAEPVRPPRTTDTPELAAAVADALIHLGFKTWDFGDSVAFEALIAASDALGDERWVRFAHGYGRAWSTRSRPFVRLDCTVPGRALVGIAVRFDDAQLLATLTELADYLMHPADTSRRVRDVGDARRSSPPIAGSRSAPTISALLDEPPAGRLRRLPALRSSVPRQLSGWR